MAKLKKKNSAKPRMTDDDFAEFLREEEAFSAMHNGIQKVIRLMPSFSPEEKLVIAGLIAAKREGIGDKNVLHRIAKLPTLSPKDREHQFDAWIQELKAGGRRQ